MYTGIIKTMPQTWLKELPAGVEGWEKDFMNKCNKDEKHYWVFNLPGKPKYEVLYFYILYSGAIRYRANIIGYEKLGEIKCYTGDYHAGKIWVAVGAPVIKLKEPVPMKGFQGFRYIEDILQ